MAFPALIVLTVIASLNRETALVIPALYWAFYGFTEWRKLLILVGVWAGVTAGLHVVLGSAPHMLGLEGTIAYNVANLGDGLFVNVTLIPLWIALVIGFRHAPLVLKRFVGVGLVYMAAIVVGAAWNEVLRLALPVFVLVLPVILSEDKRGNTHPSATTSNR